MLAEPVLAFLRFHRHDLAGRIQVLLAAVEMIGMNDSHEPSPFDQPVELLRDVLSSWREELGRCDLRLNGTPMPYPVRAHRLEAIIGEVLPDRDFLTDPVALAQALRYGHKAIGRTSLFAHTSQVHVSSTHAYLDMRSGSCSIEPDRPLHLVLPGDGDAAFCEAEAHLAGVTASGSRDEHGVIIRLAIPFAQQPSHT